MTTLGQWGPTVVVGAGQAGPLLSIHLARQGHDVELFESRPDLRRSDIDAGRSINLALATRGLVPLTELGLRRRVDAITVPMAGRMVHATDGTTSFQPYGTGTDDVIHSVSRRDLNAILLDAAEETGRVHITFDRWCHGVDIERRLLSLGPYGRPGEATDVPFGTVFGCDGAGSEIRRAVVAANGGSVETDALDHGYKELEIPPGPGGGFLLDPGALHIWPRGDFMLIALPNPAGDFTTTLFLPHRGPVDSFAALGDGIAVERFFAREFPDVAELIPDLVDQFASHPTGSLATVRVDGWSVGDAAVLVGDAAHGIVPFHGQGMNLAMESCRLLDRELRARPDDVAAAFTAFERSRKPAADAIADMAIDNYQEMRSGVVDPDYLLRRQLALELERRHPDRVAARYGMVMFTTMPYDEVQRRNEAQQAVFSELIADASSLDDVDFERAANLVEALGPLPDWI
ncbi:MAG: FAD-dependent oxidoreductase [Acidimicrobiales bacterium]